MTVLVLVVLVDEGFRVLFKDKTTLLQSPDYLPLAPRGNKDIVGEIGCDKKDRSTYESRISDSLHPLPKERFLEALTCQPSREGWSTRRLVVRHRARLHRPV